MDSLSLPGMDEQERLLTEARNAIKRHAFQMRKAISEDNMRESLRYAAAMLGELRTSSLSPQKYYELYMLVFDQLVNLEAFFGEERSKGRTYSELYELVQHAGNVLPRLYLMVAVGCLYIKSGEAGARDVLKDLVEMCKGVQHPTRGLFLRSYLCQRSRGLLPDTASPVDQSSGTLADSLDFLISNFIEMNKLWVRMQHQGSARDKDKRERERQQLQDLVGKNLTYLSQLDGLTFEVYSTQVLQRVLEQVVGCKDDIAQQYLMQCVIQGFPDAFHLGSLDALLGALPGLQPGVKIHGIMSQLMDRLARYATSDKAAMERLLQLGAFARFRDAIAHVVASQADMAPADTVEMYVALMNFTGAVHPSNIDNVNLVLAAAYQTLSPRGLGGDPRAEKALVSLLSLPLAKYDVVTGLGLSEYPLLLGLLKHRTHKDLAVKIIQTVLDAGTKICNGERVAMLLRFVQPLVQDPEEGPVEELAPEDLEEEQSLVARLLHHLVADDCATQLDILATARDHLVRGGPRRYRHTLPALGFCGLKLERRLAALGKFRAASPGEVSCESVLQWLLATATLLADVPEPMMGLRLMLAAGLAASEEARLEDLAYGFFEQAFTLYEESIPDQRQRLTALQAIMGTLHRCYIFGPENRESLMQAVSGYSAKLLKRTDQCLALCWCSHLAWQDEVAPSGSGSGSPPGQPAMRDGAKVLNSLKRAIKAAGAAKQQLLATAPARAMAGAGRDGAAGAGAPGAPQQPAPAYLALYVEILNHYLYYFDRGVDLFTPGVVQQMMENVKVELQAAGISGLDSAAGSGSGSSGSPLGQAGGAPGGLGGAVAAPSGSSGFDPATYWALTMAFVEGRKRKAEEEVRQRYAELGV